MNPISLQKEKEAITRSTKLRWLHWVVVAGSLIVTFYAWQLSRQQSEDLLQKRFDFQSAQVVGMFIERMQKYDDALSSGVGAIQSKKPTPMDLLSWRSFAKTLQLPDKYPGINGIGIILPVDPPKVEEFLKEKRVHRPQFQIHPQHDQKDLLPITYIEPETSNEKAVGLDMAHEKNRYQAALLARDTGMTQITGPITLVQDKTKTPGFLFFSPYYSSIENPKNIDDRRKMFEGIVYAPFIVNKLMAGTLAKTERQIGLQHH